jgi:hypothetical protein
MRCSRGRSSQAREPASYLAHFGRRPDDISPQVEKGDFGDTIKSIDLFIFSLGFFSRFLRLFGCLPYFLCFIRHPWPGAPFD